MIFQIKNEETVLNNVGDKCALPSLGHHNSSKEM
jgi:hypothetical protein